MESESYGDSEIYEDAENLDSKFKKITPSILKLKPKDVRNLEYQNRLCGMSNRKLNQVN
ncbi:MAG: hypothetical protein KGI09_02460 [Thaumarchaeota archaeon]|nr:hypothetical protein [Nitrososphaerota archaeon]